MKVKVKVLGLFCDDSNVYGYCMEILRLFIIARINPSGSEREMGFYRLCPTHAAMYRGKDLKT